MVTNDAMESAFDEINWIKGEPDELKEKLALALHQLDYALAMGWTDRAHEAIGQLGELL